MAITFHLPIGYLVSSNQSYTPSHTQIPKALPSCEVCTGSPLFSQIVPIPQTSLKSSASSPPFPSHLLLFFLWAPWTLRSWSFAPRAFSAGQALPSWGHRPHPSFNTQPTATPSRQSFPTLLLPSVGSNHFLLELPQHLASVMAFSTKDPVIVIMVCILTRLKRALNFIDYILL